MGTRDDKDKDYLQVFVKLTVKIESVQSVHSINDTMSMCSSCRRALGVREDASSHSLKV